MEKRVGIGFLALRVTTDENANGSGCAWRRELLDGGCAGRTETLLAAGNQFVDS